MAALHEFERWYSSAPPEIQADAFRLFRAFYAEIVCRQDRRFYRRQDLQKVLHSAADQIGSHTNPLTSLTQSFRKKYRHELEELNEYRKCGMSFTCGEGDWYLVEDPDFLIRAARLLSGEYRDYLVFYCFGFFRQLPGTKGHRAGPAPPGGHSSSSSFQLRRLGPRLSPAGCFAPAPTSARSAVVVT